MSEETQVLDEPQAAEAPLPEAPPETPPEPVAEEPEPEPADDPADRIAALQAELAQAQKELAGDRQNREALALIGEAEAEVEEAAEEMEAAKKVAAARKKDWESAVLRLQKVIRDAQSGQLRLPFAAAATPKPADPPAPAPPEAKADATEPDDSWKGVLLTALTLPDGKPLSQGILDALAEKDILTVFDVGNWSAPRPVGKGQRLIDVPGIGPGKAEQIESALEEFWRRRALDAKATMNAAIVEAVEATEAEQAESAGPLAAPPELTEANAWRIKPSTELGLPDGLVAALKGGGLHSAQDVAFAVFTDYVDTLPGIDTPEDLAEIRAALERLKQGLPDAQAFDFAEFEASHIPTPADERPITETRGRKRARKTTEKAAPTA